MGVQLILLEHPTPIKDIECLKAGACDVILLPLDDRAANVADFSSPDMQFEYTFLVPAGSSMRNFADVDRAGVRIAVVRNHASTNAQIPLLKQAVRGDPRCHVQPVLRWTSKRDGISPSHAS